VDTSRGTLFCLIMARRTPPSDNAGMHAFLDLTVGVFSILFAFSAFAQGNQPQPAYEPEPPPLGYPQPGYPPQNYPQQGYPEQSPPQSFPPPSSNQAASPVSTPGYARGMLVMPYVGFATPVGSASNSYDTGLRIGSLLGWHLNRRLSVNVELTLDILNPKGFPSGISDSTLDSSFGPLVHLPIGRLEIVVGPKIGFFQETLSYTGNSVSYSDSYNGFLFGANLGVLAGLGMIAIGGLFSYTGRYYSNPCQMINDVGNSCTNEPGTFHTVSLSGVVLF
jgi:hypothetical protein